MLYMVGFEGEVATSWQSGDLASSACGSGRAVVGGGLVAGSGGWKVARV